MITDFSSQILRYLGCLAFLASAPFAYAAVPTINATANLTGAIEDVNFTISYADLVSATGAADVDSADLVIRLVSQTGNRVRNAAATAVIAPGDTLSPGQSWTWVPPADQNGSIQDFSVEAFAGGEASANGCAVTIDVTPVNDRPGFAGSNVSVAEDSGAYSQPWATSINKGHPNESAQTVSFVVDSFTNPGLFTGAVTVDDSGVLNFTPATNQSGVSTIQVKIVDSGDTSNGGVRESGLQNYTITVTAVDDPPTINATATLTGAIEDVDFTISYADLVSATGAADVDSADLVIRLVSQIGNSVRNAAATAVIAPGGTLSPGQSWTWRPPADQNGSIQNFTVEAFAGGEASANGCAVTIDVTPVNDRPGFSGSNVSVAEDSGAYSQAWATNIDKGHPNESAQTVSFVVDSFTNPGLFTGAVTVDDSGVLNFTPAPDQNGVSTIQVKIVDSGDTSNGGVKESGLQDYTITVREEIDLEVSVSPLRSVIVAGGDPVGTFAVTVTNSGPSDATGVVVSQTSVFPAGVSISSTQPSTGSFSAGDWTLDLAEGVSATLSVFVVAGETVASGVDTVPFAMTMSASDQPDTAAGNDSDAASVSVVNADDTGVSVTAAPVVSLQSGLFVSEVTITNNTGSTIPAARLFVSGLPGDVSVHNASGTDSFGALPAGTPYLLSNADLADGDSVVLTVEFLRENLDPDFTPQYAVELLADDEPAAAAGISGVPVERMVPLPSGDILVEFTSQVGAEYAVEYSADMSNWIRVTPTITAVANRTQWTDNGPPKTMSHPSTVPQRFYRFALITPPI